jgi:hypothetical protein
MYQRIGWNKIPKLETVIVEDGNSDLRGQRRKPPTQMSRTKIGKEK